MDRHYFHDVIRPLLVDDTRPVIKWMMENEILPRERVCSKCNEIMSLNKYSKVKDGYHWKCYTMGCVDYKKTISIRKDSILFFSKLSLQIFVHGIYCWCSEFSQNQTSEVLNISLRTTQQLYEAFRMACTNYFKENPIKLGGKGTIVQIDESCFSHKVKHHRGRGPAASLWVFGLVDCSTSPVMG